MVKNNPTIAWVLVSFIFTIFFYNVFAVYVTHLLSSVWHAILGDLFLLKNRPLCKSCMPVLHVPDNFRPVSVWGTDLLLFYVFTRHVFGEPWVNSSYIQAAGMVVLFVGTAVYNGSIKLPGMMYPHDEDHRIG